MACLELPESGANVVILEHRPIVVQQSFIRSGHDVKIIGGARMLEVVNDGGDQGGEDF